MVDDTRTHVDDAIACYMKALDVITKESEHNWVTLQLSLGGAYYERKVC
jgi:hypothetical protein